MSGACNISTYLQERADAHPDKDAVIMPIYRGLDGKVKYRTWSFRQLNDDSDRLASGLEAMGICDGMRTLLMVRPGFDFISLTYALFKAGAVPVLIDPGMGKNSLLDCVKNAEPEALVAIPKAHLARWLYPAYFRSVTRLVTAGKRLLWGGKTVADLRSSSVAPYSIKQTSSNDMAAILFTTGSTGPPKGVVYEHGMFDAQVKLLKSQYGLNESDVDLPAFPLFALFSIAIGMSVVIPDMDPTRPAEVDPAKFVESINENSVTITFGSPAIWDKVSEYCVRHDVTLPTLKRVLMAGAPVSEDIHYRLLTGILPEDGATYTPFGATESLPIADIDGHEVINDTAALTSEGRGVCVGKALNGITIRIIKITEDDVMEWDDELLAPQGEIGEIVVSGPVVTKEYYNMPERTRSAKIIDKQTGAVFHRMGDVGYIDEKDRLWFCGRKGHRVITKNGTLYTIQCEAVFNQSPDVIRTALVGLGEAPDQEPVIIAELNKELSRCGKTETRRKLLEIGAGHPLTRSIKKVFFHKKFPTDVRHNAKIFREKLKVWAEKIAQG